MNTIRRHTIRLKPNNKQATYFAKASGVARFAYNWALNEWAEQYKAWKEDNTLPKPNKFSIDKKLNAIKREQFPWMMEVTKCAAQQGVHQLGKAFQNFFLGRAKYPQFKKKGVRDGFELANDKFKTKGKKVQIPKLGWVRMAEELRFEGKICTANVIKRGGHWFISIAVETSDKVILKPTGSKVGLDLGLTAFATLSDGTKIEAPKPLRDKLIKLRRLNKSLSRKKKGSRNREKAKAKLSRLHYQISCVRKDFLHKLTTSLVKAHDVIAIEDLNVRGMVKNKRLSRAINDVGFHAFKQQLEYKAQQWGKQIKQVDRFFPSSKTCHVCSHRVEQMPLCVREWVCPVCKTKHDRDINAAKNILANAV